MRIHESAIVDPSAELGEDVIIHPFTVVEGGVRIGDGCEIGPHAVIRTGTRMGKRNRVTVGAVLGDHPQDAKFHGEESYLELGDDNEIREYCTIHRASGEGASTIIGNGNMLMAYCHVGHNCHIGNKVSMANSAQLAGHTHIDDFAALCRLCLARHPATATKELQSLNAPGPSTYPDIAGDSLLYGTSPPRETSM